MVFFLSIGLLIDLGFIWRNLGEILLMLLIVTLGKTAMNVGVLRFLKEPWPRAWLGGVALGQVGEFSFVILALGLSVGAIGDEGYRLFVAVIALSLIISPLWLDSARRIQRLAVHADTLKDLLARLYPLATARTHTSIVWTRERGRDARPGPPPRRARQFRDRRRTAGGTEPWRARTLSSSAAWRRPSPASTRRAAGPGPAPSWPPPSSSTPAPSPRASTTPRR